MPADRLLSPARKAALFGLLAALALALSALESLLPPLPVPGLKLGLSNLATLFALSSLGLPAALAVTAVKALFALLRSGTACLMSLSGGLFSTLVMALLRRFGRTRFSPIGIGIAGSLAHNTAQLLVAMLLLNRALIGYAPVLLVASLATGTVTGTVFCLLLPPLHNALYRR